MTTHHPAPLARTLQMSAIDLAKVRAMRPAAAPPERPWALRAALLAATAIAGVTLGALPFVAIAALI